MPAILLPALAAAAVVLLIGAREGRDGSRPVRAERTSSPRTLGARASRELRPLLATQGRSGVRGQQLEDLAGGVRPALPDQIAIPAAGVDTVVDSVGTTGDGEIQVPDLGRAGWYDGGPRPGEPGRTVIIGHLDTGRGPGLFAQVPDLQDGEAIRITDRRGRVHAYSVVGRSQVRKDEFPTDAVYGGTGPSVLVLVTCGGPFADGHYRDNILVYARAV